MSLYKVLGGAAVALAALTSRADAGTLSGRLTDMFSGAPYNGATITAVNESTQEAYDATSGLMLQQFNQKAGPGLREILT